MRTNYAEFTRALEAERPSWEALCAEFADAGLIDRTGKPPSTATARKTWERVRKDVAAARTKAESKSKAAVPLPSSTPATEPAPLPFPVPCEPRRPVDQKPSYQQGSGTAAEKVQAAYASLRAREIPVPERINPSKTKDG
jgi:hypothetical protein